MRNNTVGGVAFHIAFLMTSRAFSKSEILDQNFGDDLFDFFQKHKKLKVLLVRKKTNFLKYQRNSSKKCNQKSYSSNTVIVW